MKTRYSLFLIILLFATCQSNQLDNTTARVVDTGNNKRKVLSVTDSLEKYSKTDSLFQYETLKFYSGSTNDHDFGLVELTDTSFALYQKNHLKWSITDTFPFPLFYVYKPQDLNGDSYKDLIITYAASGAGGNGQNICLIYNPRTEKLYHNKYFDLPNIKYDKKTNLVLSPWWNGQCHCQYKESFKISADSLTFNLGVMFCPVNNNEQEPEGVQFYKVIKGKKIITKRLKGNPKEMWTIFENAIWDSKDEF